MGHSRKKYSDCFSLVIIALVIICFLMIPDPGTTAALRHLAVVFCISFFTRSFMPAGGSFDERFGLRFGLGLFLCFYPAWVISAVFSVEYSYLLCYITFGIMAVGSFAIREFSEKKPYFIRSELSGMLKGFAIFAVIYLAFFWMIGFNPVIDSGTENYMDFGFMQTIWRQKAAIPKDIWFSGTDLNYYYLGQSASVYLCILSHVSPEYGYNLMLATFIGMVFVMVFEIVYSLALRLLPGKDTAGPAALSGGLAGAFTAALGANPHWLIYGIIVPFINKIKGTPSDEQYWFPDGTVYIRTDLGDPDNGKNEFPAYSALLGDLHAHVINLIFVLPLIILLFDCCFDDEEEDGKFPGLWQLILISMLLGYYKGSNYWDFAIYFVITGAVITFTQISRRGFTLSALLQIVIRAAVVTAVSFIIIIPFTVGFVKMESGIGIAQAHSPAFKLLVLWGLPVAASAVLIGLLYAGKDKDSVPSVVRSGLLAFILCTIGLVITPEFVFVKDIYGDANARFNTMFKLTYQAYVLFAIIIGILFAVTASHAFDRHCRHRCADAFLCVMGLLIILTTAYTPQSAYRWFGDITDLSQRKGISGLEYLRDDMTYGFEMEAYDVLAADPGKIVNIVEAAGDSYTHESALSVYSGACTPAGWFVHEWMWHNDPEPIRERSDRVSYFYRCGDEEYCRDFLKLYDIDYIFVGPAEVCKYPVNWDGFKNLGDVCVKTVWSGVDLALIKVDRNRL
ncbi:MAG: hypothetical protein IKO16_03450 [Lachnospiraceae bacterium]|nr:hypothetical protein [Lachnospiraceae bacterium]